MLDPNRDLLVLSKSAQFSPEEMDKQVKQLNRIIYQTENWEMYCRVNEVINVNKHTIIRKPHLIQKEMTEKWQKPFVFLCNKN